MNTLRIEEDLSKEYGYKKLPEDISAEYRQFYLENIPSFLELNGDNISLFDIYGVENKLIVLSLWLYFSRKAK